MLLANLCFRAFNDKQVCDHSINSFIEFIASVCAWSEDRRNKPGKNLHDIDWHAIATDSRKSAVVELSWTSILSEFAQTFSHQAINLSVQKPRGAQSLLLFETAPAQAMAFSAVDWRNVVRRASRPVVKLRRTPRIPLVRT